eukprot:TRINITY_DN405_c1_g2_i1.p1 TRINITY_DN405_c1_g2~~TRINITY_DN405_c1_g2_i1.p1  ORF type:complete len:159 (+),score=34.53 TRINITY_DN405_c1_g2_i1:87-563(+)
MSTVEELRDAAPIDERAAYDILREADLQEMQELQKRRLDFRFWRNKAAGYKFGKGEVMIASQITFPRLEHYKQCHDVAKDWMRCKSVNSWVRWTGICAPLKDQLTMCINDTWIERHEHRNKMTTNVYKVQEQAFHGTRSRAHYDKAFYSLMLDDADAD